jgi:hypothetical protein
MFYTVSCGLNGVPRISANYIVETGKVAEFVAFAGGPPAPCESRESGPRRRCHQVTTSAYRAISDIQWGQTADWKSHGPLA